MFAFEQDHIIFEGLQVRACYAQY